MSANSFQTNLSINKELNITTQPQNHIGWLALSDTHDYYSFSLTSRSSFNLALNNLRANADVQVLDAGGSVVASSNRRGKRSEYINATLDPGNYFIAVNLVDGFPFSYYNLKVYSNEAPQGLKFTTNKTSYEVGESIILTDTQVFDGNGVNDIARVDFRLRGNDGNWRDISDAVNFVAKSTNEYTFNYSLAGLESGNYQLSGQAYDIAGASTEILQTSFEVLPDWFGKNIQNTAIQQLSRSYFGDQVLNRYDMIAILRQAQADGVVDATEFKDFQTLISNGSNLGIPEYVRVLSSKVVNGDAANNTYQGNALGNLQPGSNGTHIEKLINKWFFGSDRPTTPYSYQYANGSLFQNGVNYQDIKQGSINDCFFLVGLAAVANVSPITIENMFIDNGDGTFTVRFWKNGVSDYVTVDRYLPINSAGNFVYANKDNLFYDQNNELWVALAEKAYAQLNESGWIFQDNTNSYNGINQGGFMADAFAHITGRSVFFTNPLHFPSVVNAFNSGYLVGLGTKSFNIASNLVPNHGYALIGYNSSNQKFTLFNPWGINNNSTKPGLVELSWNEIEANFTYWDSTEAYTIYTT
jgi:hypothetical protein